MTLENRLPHHIAFIPDGNRRWAKHKGVLASLGHDAGTRSAEAVVRAVQEVGVQYLSFWGCSIGNVTKRDSAEVQFLYQIFKDQFKKLLEDPETHEKKIRVRVIGEWREYFPPDLQSIIEQLMEKTSSYENLHLTFLMAYSGVTEMLSAIKSLGVRGDLKEKNLEWSDVKHHLYTRDLPPVDLVIRTGDEPHLSEGFMMWDTTNAQLYFSELLWPDFTPEALRQALESYGARERRMGK